MNYSNFKEIYDNLCDKYKSIVFCLLRDMEHNKDNSKDKIEYSQGFKFAMAEQDISTNELAAIIEKKKGYINIRNSVASCITKGYTRSEYFNDILEILEIDESYLIKHSKYFLLRECNMEWCFNSISKINQDAVYNLMLQLSNIQIVHNSNDSFEYLDESTNLGLISDVDNIINY